MRAVVREITVSASSTGPREGRLRSLLTLTVLTFCIFATTASAADVKPFETKSYSQHFDLPAPVAEEHLEAQHEASGIVEQIEDAQGGRYAGVWFDNQAGEFVVPVLVGTSAAAVSGELDRGGLEGDFRTVPARASWQKLEAVQAELDAALLPRIEAGLVRTGLDPRTNSVVIEVAAGIGDSSLALVQDKAAEAQAPVTVLEKPEESFQALVQCRTMAPRACDRPMRGGVAIEPTVKEGITIIGECSAGFKATDPSGNRYVLTAGHCTEAGMKWSSPDSKLEFEHPIGTVTGYTYPGGDWAKILANGSFWDQSPWPTEVTHYWEDQERAITSEASSYLGEYVCHSGTNSGTTCGNVTALNKTLSEVEDGNKKVTLYHETEFKNVCSRGGDSGGPVFAGTTALGIYNVADHETAFEGPCNTPGFFMEITEATTALGVSVAPRPPPPPTTETGEVTNIKWNQATLKGTVNPNGTSTSYYFQYGITTSYGEATGASNAGAGSSPVPVNLNTGFLKASTTYHYRLVASNSAGTTYGADRTFRTASAGVFFSDVPDNNSMTNWSWGSTSGWQQEFLFGHAIAPGTSPVTLKVNGYPNVFYVDANDNNTITRWSWSPSVGWQQEFFYGHSVAKGSSPSAVVDASGTIHVYFADANNNNSITEWNSAGGWHQVFLYGHPVSAGSSPSTIINNGYPQVYFSDAANNNSITVWSVSPSTGWQQTFLYGHPLAKGSSPSALNYYGNPEVFFSDAANNNSMTIWAWNAAEGWGQVFLYGHALTAGSSPSTVLWEGHQQAYFSDAVNNNSMSAWVGTLGSGWSQAFLFGHQIAAGTSPSATLEGSGLNVYFVDALNSNSITDWKYSSGTGWHQEFLYGHQVTSGSSPGGF